MPPLLLISPMFPPMEGGLPDHTDRLARALAPQHALAVLTSEGVDTARAFTVHARMPTWQAAGLLEQTIAAVAPTGPLLWQYVPHMYGRGGVNFALPRVLRRLRAQGRRQVVLAHEIAAPWSPWPHRAFYALAHRLMWRGICQAADALGISTDAWLTQLKTGQGSAPGIHAPPGTAERFFLAPSPSNLPVADVASEHLPRWRADHGLVRAEAVVGFFGSTGSGKQFEWILAAWRTLRRRVPATALVVIGGRPNPALDPDEVPWFKPLGYLAAQPASAALQALDLLLLPFVDGVSERRSSFMAGLAHGLPVVTIVGRATGASLRSAECFAGVPPDRAAFTAAADDLLRGDPAPRHALGTRARAVYEARYDWPRLAEHLAHHLSP